MIIIREPHLQVKSGKARLSAKISIPEAAYDSWVRQIGGMERYAGYEKMYQRGQGEFELWYETEDKYAPGMCCERNDAFVLAMIYFAMITGEDIKSLAPVSNELAHNLNTYLIPLHCNDRTGYRTIRVMAETECDPLGTVGENGTGISCGVDSLDTVLRYCEEDMDPEHRLTCLCLFNTGAFYSMPDMKKCIAGTMTVREWDEKAEEQFESECVRGKKAADELGLGFVPVNSNISSLYQGAFLQSHAYRNCSAVLALEKLFGHYYYASAGESEKLWTGLENDASDNVWLYSTETVRFYMGSRERTRIEKLEFLSGYDVAKKYLHVCSNESYNCGKCGKCFRTMLILELIGKLDQFAPAFESTELYEKKKWKKFVWILDKRPEDQFAVDMYAYMKKNNMHIPAIAWIYHYTLPVRRMIKKVIKK